MKYKLLVKSENCNHQLHCTCGKCEPAITIDESMREEFKKLMSWSEDKFQRLTMVVDEEITAKTENSQKEKGDAE